MVLSHIIGFYLISFYRSISFLYLPIEIQKILTVYHHVYYETHGELSRRVPATFRLATPFNPRIQMAPLTHYTWFGALFAASTATVLIQCW